MKTAPRGSGGSLNRGYEPDRVRAISESAVPDLELLTEQCFPTGGKLLLYLLVI